MPDKIKEGRFLVQHEIDDAIRWAISIAVRCEETRDAQEWESRSYWEWHDRGIAWHEAARSLMPKGS